MRFLVDYDATLAQTDALRYDWINERFGTDYHPSNATTWLNSESGYMEPEHDEWGWSTECFLNEEFQSQVEPVVGAIDGMQYLHANGHELMVVSDRPKDLFEVTRDWLDEKGLAMIRLLFTTHKHSMSTDKKGMLTKAQVAYLYKLNAVIEDGPHHVTGFQDKDYISQIYLLDYPYNRHVKKHKKIKRVKGWEEIVKDVR